MSEVFTAQEYGLAYPEGIETHFWHIARHHALLHALRGLELEDELIVDVGCGVGITTHFLHERGYNIRGVERGEAPIPPDRRQYVATGQDLFALDPQFRQDIHCVLLLDVIEHVEDRETFLRDIYTQLPDCQYLVVTVPARQELWSEFDTFWGHQLRYDRPTLAGDLQRGGFTVVENSYHFQLAYLAAMALKTLGRQRGTTFDTPGNTPLAAFLHRVLGFYGRLENRLVPRFIAGSSILATAIRKPG